jgi:tetratricopeptide (TPR) repeat protein
MSKRRPRCDARSPDRRAATSDYESLIMSAKTRAIESQESPAHARPDSRDRGGSGLSDANGLAVSADRIDSLRAFDDALELTLSGRGGASGVIGRALIADPTFVMGYALRAALLVMAADEAVEAELARTLRAADALGGQANARERRHLAAARSWLERDLPRAVRLYGEILDDHPRDILALRVAHSGDFQLNQTLRLCDRVARVLPHWNETMPHYGYVLGMHAFGLEEAGHYAQAERVGRRALALIPRNPGAIHAVAHVMEMQGRPRDGIAWLESTTPQWIGSGGYAAHLWWHAALFHLDLDQTARALDIYDRHLRSVSPHIAGVLVDASAILWRLHLRGMEIAERWREVADRWEAKPIGGLRPFNDVHAMLAFVAAGREASARRLLDDLRRSAERSRVLNDAIHNSALPLCEALLAFGRGDHADAVERLIALRRLVRRCGGSKAQCDLVHLTLLEAALRARRTRLAHSLVSERIAHRPASVFNERLRARVVPMRRLPDKKRRSISVVAA